MAAPILLAAGLLGHSWLLTNLGLGCAVVAAVLYGMQRRLAVRIEACQHDRGALAGLDARAARWNLAVLVVAASMSAFSTWWYLHAWPGARELGLGLAIVALACALTFGAAAVRQHGRGRR